MALGAAVFILAATRNKPTKFAEAPPVGPVCTLEDKQYMLMVYNKIKFGGATRAQLIKAEAFATKCGMPKAVKLFHDQQFFAIGRD